jgi:hypothetical protein
MLLLLLLLLLLPALLLQLPVAEHVEVPNRTSLHAVA